MHTSPSIFWMFTALSGRYGVGGPLGDQCLSVSILWNSQDPFENGVGVGGFLMITKLSWLNPVMGGGMRLSSPVKSLWREPGSNSSLMEVE